MEIACEEADELRCIYIILRKLRCAPSPAFRQPEDVQTDKQEYNLTRLFPKQFILKLIDDRLIALADAANKCSGEIFSRIIGTKSTRGTSQLDTQPSSLYYYSHSAKTHLTPRYKELDEFFHWSLHHVHDFLIDFDWYDANINILNSEEQEYVRSKLKYIDSLLKFQKTLDKLVWQLKENPSKQAALNVKITSSLDCEPQPPAGTPRRRGVLRVGSKSPERSPGSDVKSHSSPSGKRRVRFKDVSLDRHDNQRLLSQTKRDISDRHSEFALDLLLFALSLFIQKFTDHLVDWSDSSFITQDLNNFLDSLFESKTKIRVNQLKSIAHRIKVHNDANLMVLDLMHELKQVYLTDLVFNTLIANDPTNLRDNIKAPRVGLYIQKLGVDVEGKIIIRITRKFLQVFFDLAIGELNLPPAELYGGTKTRSREDIVRGHDNIVNFIKSWLNIGVHDSDVQPADHEGRQKKLNAAARYRSKESDPAVESNLQFNSSSRILVQMDNLSELMNRYINEIVDRLNGVQQISFFIGCLYRGLDQLFDRVSSELRVQIEPTQTAEFDPGDRQENQQAVRGELDPDTRSVDATTLAIKIRCFKFTHIMSNVDKIILDGCRRVGLAWDKSPLESKITKFSETYVQSKSHRGPDVPV